MTSNFKIIHFTEVHVDGLELDVHNNYGFLNMNVSNSKSTLTLKKYNEEWVSKNDPEKLFFNFYNISFFYEEEGDNSEFPEDENTLSSVTFVSESTRDNNELLGMNELPDKSDDILFTFENGKLFRLQCEQIKLTYET